MSFGYRNGKILRLLEKRGKFLGNGKFKEAQDLDKDIIECLDKNMTEITTPVCAFITFTT